MFSKFLENNGITEYKIIDNGIFRIVERVIELSSRRSCPSTTDPLQNSITSPNYPRKYRDDTDCEWRIFASPGGRIRLHFNDFSTENSNDKLFVYDGPRSSSRQISRLSGSTVPNNIISTGNSLYLRFQTDSSSTSKGFAIQYSFNYKS